MTDKKRYRISIGSLDKFRDHPSEFRYGISKIGVFQGLLFGFLGKEGAFDYIGYLKGKLGEQGYRELVDSIVQELAPPSPKPTPPPAVNVPPSPEQLELFQSVMDVQAFLKDANKEHPGAKLADIWKTNKRMEFVTFEQLEDRLSATETAFSAKMDGELVCIWFENGRAELVTAKGTLRWGFPVTNEVATAVGKKYKQAAFMGELYAVDNRNRPISYMQAASMLKDPDAGYDDQLRLAVFDVMELDGKSVEDLDIMEKMDMIFKIFDGLHAVHAAYTKKGTFADIKELWNELDKRGLEGIVVHMPDGTILKSKPILSFDMVIVAVAKSTSIPGRVGAVLAAFIDKEGRYRLNGHIGTGLRDEQRIELMNMAKRIAIKEDDKYIWIDPTKSPVIEVEAIEINPKKQPALEFRDGEYVEVEKMMCGVMRFPVLKQMRTDKDPKYPDVRIEQLPIQLEESAIFQVGMHIKSLLGHTGVIIGLVPNSGDSGKDYDIIVEWDEPVWGVEVSEVHPTEVQMIGIPESSLSEQICRMIANP
jgi:hypothetical protein